MGYEAIENYGIVGDMHAAALVSREGSVDWLCLPRFDSPAIFASILDDQKGGSFSVAPVREDVRSKQFYWPDSNVLITRFLCADGVGQITDFMPVGLPSGHPTRHHLIRQVRATRGTLRFRLRCAPAFNFARDSHAVHLDASGARFDSRTLSVQLFSPVSLNQTDSGAVTAEFTLEEGEEISFALGVSRDGLTLTNALASEALQSTVVYWRQWLSKCTYSGRWREIVYRSALVLKLLTYEPTGAIVAAPTTSLPEGIGGHRNWDYRYTWIRDAAFTLYALLRIGFTEEAAAFMGWLEERAHESGPRGPLQIMYAVDGTHELVEEELSHLDGYMGSKPVRVGNAAYGQLQLDIYGELMDSVYLYNKYGSPISYDLWSHLRKLVDWTADNWHRKDEGIWEVRGGQQHFVYSKLMCWVALDRGLRLADKRSFPAPRTHWQQVRDSIYEEIMTKGWNQERGAFTQAYGSTALDAANLL
ncbi:MAG: glycoside hydrolase family 15 protein [Myxococcota bacterium]